MTALLLLGMLLGGTVVHAAHLLSEDVGRLRAARRSLHLDRWAPHRVQGWMDQRLGLGRVADLPSGVTRSRILERIRQQREWEDEQALTRPWLETASERRQRMLERVRLQRPSDSPLVEGVEYNVDWIREEEAC